MNKMTKKITRAFFIIVLLAAALITGYFFLNEHMNNTNIHITAEERAAWNNKANADLTNIDNTIFKAKVEASGFSSGSAVQILTWEATD